MKFSLSLKAIGLSVLFVLLSVSIAFAQDFEGKIVYQIEYKNLPAEMEGYESMLPSESTFYLKGENSRFEQNMGMAGTQTLITNTKTKNTFMLMDLMGQKLKIPFSQDDLEVEKAAEPTVKKLKGTKKIAGYKCKLAEVTYPATDDSPENKVEVYYCPKIQGNGHSQFKMLGGFPMEYTTSMQGMEVTISAKSISDESVSDEYFTCPEGYTEMTMEELQQSLGGGQ